MRLKRRHGLSKARLKTPQLTKATWRRGRKFRLRKRVHNYAGRTTAHPNFLAAGKTHGFKPGRPGYRVCSATQRNGKPCTRLAMRGCTGCEAHGGILKLAREGNFQPSGRSAAFRATQVEQSTGTKKVAELRGEKPPPFELMKLKVYRENTDQRTRVRLAQAFGTDAWLPLLRQLDPDRQPESTPALAPADPYPVASFGADEATPEPPQVFSADVMADLMRSPAYRRASEEGRVRMINAVGTPAQPMAMREFDGGPLAEDDL